MTALSSSTYARLVRECRTTLDSFDLVVLPRTPSTQDRVREAARAGAAPGYCVVAAEQTAGRGRQGRRWTAPPDTALLMSILVDAGDHVSGAPLAAGVAVCDAVRHLGATAALKWPNDVLVDGSKLAGILAEVEPGAAAGTVVVGIGVNLTNAALPHGVVATSLEACGVTATWDALLAILVPRLEATMTLLRRDGVAAIAAAWRERATGLGVPIRATTPTGDVTGVAAGIDDDGALLVDTDDGRIRLFAGDVHITR